MELEFRRRRIFNTTFVTSGASRPVYRISTIRNWLLLPHLTTIEFVAPEKEEDRRVVAQIIWNWPSQNRSYVLFGGHLYSLSQFLGCGEGFLNTDSYITFENATYIWCTHAFEPRLYNSECRQVVTYKRDPCGLRKPNSISPLGHLRIEGEIASNPMARDAVFTSFFIFKTTRNVHVPWKKPQSGALSDAQVIGEKQGAGTMDAKLGKPIITHPAIDAKGDYVQLPSEA